MKKLIMVMMVIISIFLISSCTPKKNIILNNEVGIESILNINKLVLADFELNELSNTIEVVYAEECKKDKCKEALVFKEIYGLDKNNKINLINNIKGYYSSDGVLTFEDK